ERHTRRPAAKQYHRPWGQYQASLLVGRTANEPRGDRLFESRPSATGTTADDDSTRAPEKTQNQGWNCTENSPERPGLCAPDACQNSSWNCCLIDSCTSGISTDGQRPELPVSEPAAESNPVTCSDSVPAETQYQPGTGQYQPPAIPDDEDLGGEP